MSEEVRAKVEGYVGSGDWGPCFNVRCVCDTVIVAAIGTTETCYSCGRIWLIDYTARLVADPNGQDDG